MKKIFGSIILCFILINIMVSSVYAIEITGKGKQVVTNEKTKLNTIIIDDKVYLPIREFAKNFEMEVKWINDLNTVHLITKDYKEENLEELYNQPKSGEVFIKIDNRFLNFPKVNEDGQDVFIENGVTYVPLEQIAMALGKEILIFEDTFQLSIVDKELETDGLPINEVTSLKVMLDEENIINLHIDNGVVYYSNNNQTPDKVLYDEYNIKSMFYMEDIGLYFIDKEKNVFLQTIDNYIQPVESLKGTVDIFYSGNSAFFVSDNGYYYYNKDTGGYDKVDYCYIPIKAPDKVFDDVVMSFVGDIYLSDYLLNAYNSGGINSIVDKKIQNEFLDSNITMANQEFAFSSRGTKANDKQFTFRVNPSYGKIFTEMNLDIVSLANNHSLDYGIVALKDSFDTLDKIGIEYVGAGNNLAEAKAGKYFEINNKTIGIVGATRVIPVYNWGATNSTAGMLSTYDPSINTVTSAINDVKAQSDFVVVYVHWGIEKAEKPEEYQRNLAKRYIDAGADLVVGSHPHVLQGIEYYNGKPIVYSLGNFMFYNSINQTAILKAYIDENNEVSIQLLPSKASNSKTYLVEDSGEKDRFYRYIESISYNIKLDEKGFVIK